MDRYTGGILIQYLLMDFLTDGTVSAGNAETFFIDVLDIGVVEVILEAA